MILTRNMTFRALKLSILENFRALKTRTAGLSEESDEAVGPLLERLDLRTAW